MVLNYKLNSNAKNVVFKGVLLTLFSSFFTQRFYLNPSNLTLN